MRKQPKNRKATKFKSTGVGKEVSDAKKQLIRKWVIKKPKHKPTGVGTKIINALIKKYPSEGK
ncbi:histone acetyltransferase HPA2 and related acetyltransferases [Candidatus Scalindua japonica]|uniref:Histone acetyltransferase HPA2 and related acetyltransferases n=1 Tax=Candidatus Scalindua japonica TaxID=1284222 RepID=A0A286TWZ1_9BACT|nr:hypothetical protein [Candidatus Scalindua japonica]GAX60394.1 histone acetyltransferase HPA2 and related acetyltransferases [Candidatus Scalindua japonica]